MTRLHAQGIDGALVYANAAINAGILIDLDLVTRKRKGFAGAGINASAATGAFIAIDFDSHM